MKTMVTPQTIGRCPACKVDLVLDTQVQIDSVGELKGDGKVEFTGTIVGARINHDCIKVVAR